MRLKKCAVILGVWACVAVGDTSAVRQLAEKLVGAGEQERAELLARNPDIKSGEIAAALIDLGRAERNHGNLKKALAIYDLARGIAEKAGAGASVAMAWNNIGLVQYDQGDYAQAIESHQNSLAQSESLHDDAGICRSLNNLGVVYSDIGELAPASQSFGRSLEIAQRLKAPRLISNARGNLGTISGRRGDYIQALALFTQSLEADLPIVDKRALTIDYINIGSVHLWQGDTVQAQQYFQKASDIAESAGLKPLAATAWMNLGRSAEFQGDLDSAIAKYQKSAALLTEIGNKPYSASALTFIGSVWSERGDQVKALEYLQKGLEIQQSIDARSELPLTLAQVAAVSNRKGDFRAALTAAAEAKSLSETAGVREGLWRADLERGKAHKGLGETASAESEFRGAIATIEDLRRDVAGAESNEQGFFENKLEPYHRMLDLLASAGRNSEAFEFAERAKARALVEVFQNGRTQLSDVMSAAEHDRDRDLRMRIASLNAKMVRAGAGATALKAEIQRAQLDYDGYETALYAKHPEWKMRSGDIKPVSLQEAIPMMGGPETAFIEFVVAEDRVYGFAAAGGSAHVKVFSTAVSRKDLAARVEQFRKQLAGRDLGFHTTASSLYKLLLAPAQETLGGRQHLIIIPDGALWELPFQALANPSGKYLLDLCSVSYAPSLTALKAMREVKEQRRHSAAREQLLAMGNPAWERETAERIKAVYRDESLGALPMAETEVRQLAPIYGGAQSHIYTGESARESQFKAEAGEAKVLHLATHGILNNASPLYSYLLLAGDKAKGEDGLLEARELLQMNLKAELAVLSACETARGRVSSGEGVIGLSWALLVSGVPTTVLSQWKVESESTSRLMVAFHQNRKKGLSDAEALRAAALALRKDPAFQHPFYWAPFIVIGASAAGSSASRP
jgi:CHAT domain-containing protein/Tfp pilus assembly protein PilF